MKKLKILPSEFTTMPKAAKPNSDHAQRHNTPTTESIWEAFAQEDNWQPFNYLVRQIQSRQ